MARAAPITAARRALAALAVSAIGQTALADSEPAQIWSILEIAGKAATGEAFLAIDPDGNAYGSSGCNRFQTTAKQSGAVLSFGPVAATRMACPPPRAAQEKALFRLLATRLTVSYHAVRDQMTLTAARGARLVLQRSE